MFIRLLTIVVVCIWLSGCASNRVMDASYTSKVDPSYRFAATQAIAVKPRSNGSTLETKYYISQIVQALKKRGFENVYSYREAVATQVPIDFEVIVDVSKNISSYQYQDANLGLVSTGTSTVNCTGFGAFASCTKNEGKQLGITGYSNRTGYLTGHYFAATFFNLMNSQKIMFVFASSYEEGCSDTAVYKFLIAQTINRLNFEKPVEYDYSVEMPETYSCR